MRRKSKKKKENHSLIWMLTIGLFIMFPLKIISVILRGLIDTLFPCVGRMLGHDEEYEEDEEEDDDENW